MIYEKYSLDKAETEAEKMTNLVGKDKVLANDYQIAHEVIQGELLDSYLSFDKSFFHGGYKPMAVETERQREEGAKKYKDILHNDKLQQVLSGKISVTEIPSEIIEEIHELISQEKRPSTIMAKHQGLISQEPLLAAAGIEKSSNRLQNHIASRATNHLYRLLLPEIYYAGSSDLKADGGDIKRKNTVCPSFVKDYLQYAAKITDSDKQEAWYIPDEAEKIKDVIGGENYGVKMFWTLAPYINDELKRGGLTSEMSMAEIGRWVCDAWDKQNLPKRTNTMTWETDLFKYIDSSQTNKVGFHPYKLHDYVLGFDERMPSHLYSRLYAKSIVEQMMTDKKSDKPI